MIYTFSIGGIRIRCDVPNSLSLTDCTVPFLEETDQYDIFFQFVSVDSIPLARVGTWYEDVFYASNAVYFCDLCGKTPYAKVFWTDDSRSVYICEYTPKRISMLRSTLQIMNLLSLEKLLLSHDGFILHSSFIRYQEKGILFSAPSGTGKSTQADLWKRHMGADILNGDRALLIRQSNGWMAYGLPIAGSSGIYRNESAPVNAIVVLRQAKENKIRRLRYSEAIRYLYPEVTIHRWDQKFVDNVLNLLLELMDHISVFMLECLPDESAVKLLHEILFT